MFIKKSALLVICSLVLCALVTNQVEGMERSPQRYTFKTFTKNLLQATALTCGFVSLYECYQRPESITQSWEYIKSIPAPILGGVALAATYGVLKLSDLQEKHNNLLQRTERLEQTIRNINPSVTLADRVSTLEATQINNFVAYIQLKKILELLGQEQARINNFYQRQAVRLQRLETALSNHIEEFEYSAEKIRSTTQTTYELAAQQDAFQYKISKHQQTLDELQRKNDHNDNILVNLQEEQNKIARHIRTSRRDASERRGALESIEAHTTQRLDGLSLKENFKMAI